MSDDAGDFWGKGGGKGEEKRAPKDSGLRDKAQDAGTGFYAKAGESSEPKPGEGGFWSKAETQRAQDQTERDELLKDPHRPVKRRRRVLRNVVLVGLAVVLVLLVVGGALGPTIAGSMAPGYIRGMSGTKVAGRLDVETVDLSWGGPQHVTGFVLADASGTTIAKGSVRAEVSLWSVITGSMDLGEVTLSGGRVDLVRETDGSLNLTSAVAAPGKPAAGGKGGGASSGKGVGGSKATVLPTDLKAKVIVKNLKATFTDMSSATPGVVSLEDLDLTAGVEVGKSLKVKLSATAYPGLTKPTSGAGEVNVDATVDAWSSADGTLTLNKAKGQAGVVIAGLPVELIDTLVGPVVKGPKGEAVTLRTALGPVLDLRADMAGNGKEATASVTGTVQHATVKGELKYAGGVVEAVKPVEIAVKGTALRALAPGSEPLFAADATARLAGMPDASVTIESLRLPVGDGPLDLRGASGVVRATVTQTTGTVTLEGEHTKAFAVAPVLVRVESADLSGPVRATVTTSATLDGQAAGDIRVDATLAGLLDAKGAPVGMPRSVQGTVGVQGVATAILQPFVQAAGLNLQTDVGPTLDVDVKAATGEAKAGAAAPIALDVSVKSRGVNVGGALEVSDAAITTRGEGVWADLPGAAALAGRFVKPATGWAVAAAPGGGRARVVVPSLRVPRDAGGLRLDQAVGAVSVEATGVSVTAVDAAGAARADVPGAVVVDSLRVRADVAAGDAKVDVAAGARFGASPFTVASALEVKKLLRGVTVAGGPTVVEFTPPLALRPSGTVTLREVPSGLALAVLPRGQASGPAGGQANGQTGGLDLARLVADTLGGAVNVEVTTKPTGEGGVDLGVVVQSPGVNADTGVALDKERASVRATTVTAKVSPATVETLLRAYAPSLAGGSGVQLVGDAQVRVGVEPVAVPLGKDSEPLWDRVAAAKASVSVRGRTFVDGLSVEEAPGKRRALGRLGVEDLSVGAMIPVGALVGPALADQRTLRASVSGGVLGNDGKPIAAMTGTLNAELSDAKLAGPLSGSVALEKLSTAAAEQIAGLDGLLTGLLGNTAEVRAGLTMTPPKGGTAAFADADLEAELTVSAPRLRSDGPVRVARSGDRFSLVKPAKISIEPDPGTINRFLAGADGKGLSLRQSGAVTLDLAALVLPNGTAEKPSSARPNVAVSLSLPGATLASADGQVIRLSQVVVAVTTPQPAPGEKPAASQPLAVRLGIGEAGVGEGAPAKDMAIAATLFNLYTPQGVLDVPGARLTVHGDLPTVPTALLDVLAGQKGLLVEGLGPTVAVKVDAERVPLDPAAATHGENPQVRIVLTSPRATAEVRGLVGGQVFTSQEPVRVSVAEVTKLFANRFVGLTPLIGEMEKTRDDAPAMLTATNVVAPLSNDLSKLNADIAIDPGQCRFQTSGVFGSVLKNLGQKTQGAVGTRLEPLNVTVRSGVATYGPWRLPVGEFTMVMQADQDASARGIDLVNKQIDMVVWIPAGALGDKAAGQLNTGLGSLLSRAPVLDVLTMTPWRVKGPLDKPGVSLDSELWAKTALKQLTPEKLLKGGLKDLLRPK